MSTPTSEVPEPKKEEVGSDSQKIQLKVVAQDGSDLKFNIKMTTKLGKLMDSYCQQARVSKGHVRFLYDGTRILDHHTPKELGMSEGDIIEMYSEQLGGMFDMFTCFAF